MLGPVKKNSNLVWAPTAGAVFSSLGAKRAEDLAIADICSASKKEGIRYK